MKLFKTTKSWANYWANRQIDWKKAYQDNWDHPHRFLISNVLRNLTWVSLIELGCGSGANLINLVKNFQGKQIGGVDVSAEAIKVAGQALNGALLKVNHIDDVMLSDKATDVILTDMALIYVGRFKIDRHIREIKRLARNYVVLCEFHHSNWWKQFTLKFNSGYNAYNYDKLLTKHGFYDIHKIKLTEDDWPGGDPQKTYAHIIVARVPKR